MDSFSAYAVTSSATAGSGGLDTRTMSSVAGSSSSICSAARVERPATAADRSRPPTPRQCETPTPAPSSRHISCWAPVPLAATSPTGPGRTAFAKPSPAPALHGPAHTGYGRLLWHDRSAGDPPTRLAVIAELAREHSDLYRTDREVVEDSVDLCDHRLERRKEAYLAAAAGEGAAAQRDVQALAARALVVDAVHQDAAHAAQRGVHRAMAGGLVSLGLGGLEQHRLAAGVDPARIRLAHEGLDAAVGELPGAHARQAEIVRFDHAFIRPA